MWPKLIADEAEVYFDASSVGTIDDGAPKAVDTRM